MRPLKTYWLLWLALVASQLLPGKSMAQNGGYPGTYLHIGAGARALGAGGAFVAVANDVTAGYWNPAGLGEVAAPQFGGMYSVLSLNRQHNYVAAAYPLGATGAIGISWIGYRLGNIAVRNRSGAEAGVLDNDQNTLLFSYGRRIAEKFALGGSVKLLCQNLPGASVSGTGFDLGVKFKLSEVLSLGAGVQNLQPQISWKIVGKSRQAWPVNTRAGVNVKPLPSMNLAVDYEFNAQQKGRWHAGWEILFGNMFGLRTGSDDGAFTLGASLMRLAVGSNILEVDYGFANDVLDQSASHRLAFLLKFGNSEGDMAHSCRRQKTAEPSAEKQDYEKILAARNKEEYVLAVEQSARRELVTAEPAPARSTFEQILAYGESEGTTAELVPEWESQSATLPNEDLLTENVKSENERNEATSETAPEPSRDAAEPTFEEKMALLNAQANAGERAGAETVSYEKVETTPAPMASAAAALTFEEKIAMLEAQTNAGKSGAAETVSHEKVETTPAPMASPAAELTFEEKIAVLEAQTNAGKRGVAETVSHEKVETTPAPMASAATERTFDEKIAMLEAQTNTGRSVGAETASNGNVETTSTLMTTSAADPTFEKKMALLNAQASAGERAGAETVSNESVRTARRNGMEVATPPITYGNGNGLAISAIAPGKRLGHSLAALFQAQVIEARPAYWIINLGERAGFSADMMVEIYQPTPDGETGRVYGTAQPVQVRSRYSVIKITKRRSKRVPAAGERVIFKYLYPAVNY